MTIDKKQLGNFFTAELRKILNSSELLDDAVCAREGICLKASPIRLNEADSLGIFNPDGSLKIALCELIGIEVDLSRIEHPMGCGGASEFSTREKIITDAAAFMARGAVAERYLSEMPEYPTGPLDREVQEEFQTNLAGYRDIIQEGPGAIIKQLEPYARSFLQLKKRLNRDFFNFPDTTIHICAGPDEKCDARSLDTFLDNVLFADIKRIFAIGRVYPYHPQDGISEGRPIEREVVCERDFSNYFIPDINGAVVLPTEFAKYAIESKAVGKVGRILSYAVTINGRPPILVHHYPLRDMQPLNLTQDELAFVRGVSENEKTLAHCRGGKSQSAQIAYILALKYEKYSNLPFDERLALMRSERGGADGFAGDFIATPFQEHYIRSLEQEAVVADASDRAFFDNFQLITLIFEEELSQLEAVHGGLDETLAQYQGFPALDKFSESNQGYVALLEQYHALFNQTQSLQLFEILKAAQQSPVVSRSFKALTVLSSEGRLFLDYFFQKVAADVCEDSTPVNHTVLYELLARRFDFSAVINALLTHTRPWPDNPVTRNYWPKFELIQGYIAQAYVKQYERSSEMKTECQVFVKSHLTGAIKKVFQRFDEAKRTNDEKQWAETAQLFQAVNAALYTLSCKDDAPLKAELETDCALLTKIAALGMSADVTFVDNKIQLPLGAFIKDVGELDEVVQSLITKVGEKSDTTSYIGELQQHLQAYFNECAKVEPVIGKNRKHLEAYLEALQTISPERTREQAGAESLKLWAQAWAKIFPQPVAPVEEGVSNNRDAAKQKIADAEASLDAIRRQFKAEKKRRLESAEVKKAPNATALPNKPQVWVFNLEEALAANSDREDRLFALVKQAKKHDASIVFCSKLDQRHQESPPYGEDAVTDLLEKIKESTTITLDYELVVTLQPGIPLRMRALGSNSGFPERLISGMNYPLDTIKLMPKQTAMASTSKAEPPGQIQERYESDFIVFSEDEALERSTGATNYRFIKLGAPDNKDEANRVHVQIKYELGELNALIRWLQNDEQSSNSEIEIEEALKNVDGQYSPIVRHVSVTHYNERIKTIVETQKRERYKVQFTLEAVRSYAFLDAELQKSVVIEGFNCIKSGAACIETLLERTDLSALDWQSVLTDIEALIELERLYTTTIGCSYWSVALASLKDAANTQASEVLKCGDYLLPGEPSRFVTQQAHTIAVSDAKPHPSEIENNEGFGMQKEQYVRSLLEYLATELRRTTDNCTVLAIDSEDFAQKNWQARAEDVVRTIKDRLGAISEDAASASNGTTALAAYQYVGQLEEAVNQVRSLVPIVEYSEGLCDLPAGNYTARLNDYSALIERYKSTVQANPQYQAKLFLDKAKAYLNSTDRKWQVGLQWTTHALNGVKIPKNVALQLAVIDKAETTGNYVSAQAEFLRIGTEKKQSFWSSKGSNTYFKMYRSPQVQQAMEHEFEHPTFGTS